MSPSTTRRTRARIGAALSACLALAASPAAAPQGKQDQVLWRNSRGQVNTLVGKVTKNALEQVVVETSTTERKLDPMSVQRIVFGDVPQAYVDGMGYLERSDYANSAAKFSLAASDADAREVVRARARLAAAEAWMQRGSEDASALDSARREVETFLSEYSTSRDVPQARLLLGRLQRLLGDPAKAAQTYSALYGEASGATPTPGYPPLISFQAGLAAGDAHLAAGDVDAARQQYLALDGAVGTALASVPDGDPLRSALQSIQSEARLGEGFCLLASGSVSQAKTFFQGQLNGSEGDPARRFGAHLGLGEVYLQEGKAREAQLEFAQVSAIDHTSPDRTARALVGLAESAMKLEDQEDARLWLDAVLTRHGDTPAALRAREILK